MSEKSINSILRRSTLIIISTILFSFISIIVITEYYLFQKNYEDEKQLIEDEKKLFLKSAVKNVIAYLNHEETSSENKMKLKLQDAVNNAINQANNIYTQNKGKKTNSEIKTLIKSALSGIRHFNNRGYIYIIDLEGNLIMYPFCKSAEGTNILDVLSPSGESIISEQIKAIKNKEETFHTYLWHKPWLTDSILYAKTSFVKRFNQFDWLIGCGEYIDDHNKDTKEHAIKYLKSSYSPKDWNLFINHYDGTSIIINSDKYKAGVNIKEISSDNGLKIFKKELEIAQSGNADYLYYNWPINETEFTAKLAYVDGFEKWQWMVGASSSLKQFNDIELQRMKSFYQMSWLRIILLIILSIPLMFIIVSQFRKTAGKFKFELSMLFNQIESAVFKDKKITNTEFQTKEFHQLSGNINKLLNQHFKNVDALKKSEEKFRVLVEHAPLTILGLDNNGIIQIWNKQCESFFNLSKKEVMNQKVPIDKAFEGEQKERVQNKILENDPEFKLFPIKLKNGKIAYQYWASFRVSEDLLIWVGSDVTELKNTEKELKKSRNFLDTLLESIPSPIFYKNTDGIYLGGNSAFFHLIEKDPKEIIGKGVFDLYTEDLAKIYHEKDLEVFEGNYQQYDFEYHKEGKNLRNFTYYKAPFKNQDEQIEGLIGVMLDITDRIKFETELQNKQEELKALNATKDKFFSIIAHDLINPFNVMLNSGEMLAESVNENDMQGVQEMIEMLNPAIKNAYDLLLNLLEWSRAQTGTIKFLPQKTKICDDLQSAIKLMSGMAKAKNIDLIFEKTDNPEVCLDVNMLQTITRNLISNAIKFTPEGGQIKVYTNSYTEYLQLCISDNGIGMDNATKDNLFKIDKSSSKKGTNDEPGTGLGLLLVSDFVKKHGGKITVISEPGEGTDVSVWFPIKQ